VQSAVPRHSNENYTAKGNFPDRAPSTFEAVHRIADAVNAVAATTVLVLLSETVSEVVP
jgi:hypothetical protein